MRSSASPRAPSPAAWPRPTTPRPRAASSRWCVGRRWPLPLRDHGQRHRPGGPHPDVGQRARWNWPRWATPRTSPRWWSYLLCDQARHVTGQVYTVVGSKIAVWNQPVEVRAVLARADGPPSRSPPVSTRPWARSAGPDRQARGIPRQRAASGDKPTPERRGRPSPVLGAVADGPEAGRDGSGGCRCALRGSSAARVAPAAPPTRVAVVAASSGPDRRSPSRCPLASHARQCRRATTSSTTPPTTRPPRPPGPGSTRAAVSPSHRCSSSERVRCPTAPSPVPITTPPGSRPAACRRATGSAAARSGSAPRRR